MVSKKEVVVVTGASGCLGQHTVKLLQERDENVGEIRIFDRVPYKNKLGHLEKKPMKHFVADIRDTKSVLDALSGADCVIHVASVIDLRPLPDIKEMASTNIDGTQNIIEACIKQSVPRLVYVSTASIICDTKQTFYGTESTTLPKKFITGKYGETKHESEKLVLKASEKLLSNGKNTLRTAAVRPPPIYGEEDKRFIFRILQYTKKTLGLLLRVRRWHDRLQICYAGNIAWCLIKAKDKLAVDKTISGQAFFVTDDTPFIDMHENLQPYLASRGFKISDYFLPYWFAWIILSSICMLINLINSFVKFEIDVPNYTELHYAYSSFFYDRNKAILLLDYQPIYTPKEAQERSMAYYSKVPL